MVCWKNQETTFDSWGVENRAIDDWLIFVRKVLAFQLYRVNFKCQLNKSGRFLEIPGENRLKVWIGFEFGVVVDLASRQAIRANASGSLQIWAGTRAYGTCGLYAKRAPEGNVTLLSPCAPAEPLLLTSKMPLYGQYEPLIPDHFYGYQQRGLTLFHLSFSLCCF